MSLTSCLKKAGDAIDAQDRAAILARNSAARERLAAVEALIDKVPLAVAAPRPDAQNKAQALRDLEDGLADLGSLLSKPGRLNITPEQEQKMLPILTRIFDAAFRAGYYSFKDAARFVLERIRAALGADVADQITLEHLQGAYIGMSGRYRDRGADGVVAVGAVQSKGELQGEGDAPVAGGDVEPDRADGAPDDGDLSHADVDGAGRAGRGDGQPEPAARARGERSGGAPGVDDGRAAADGERGDQPGRRGGRGAARSGSRSDDGQRGAAVGDPRVQSGPLTDEQVEAAADDAAARAGRLTRQRAADTTQVKPADAENIRQTLPLLLPGQQDDVLFAERRFAKPDGYGVLFTNSTGTGKTFTGLGIVKRFVRQGKGNVAIIAPSDEVINGWIEAGKQMSLDVTRLESTRDAGRGVVITTYENFGANEALAAREWDLVIADESHKLMENAEGTPTRALEALRAIAMSPRGHMRLAYLRNPELSRELSRLSQEAKRARTSDDQREWARAGRLQAQADRLAHEWEAHTKATEADVMNRQGVARPRVVFLSATPFAYEFDIDYAEDFLFSYHEGQPKDGPSGTAGRSYNSGDNRDRYFMQAFGYRMRYNKLTRPERGVDSGLMQRQFNGRLKKAGVLSSRRLEVDFDYDRRFILVSSRIGSRIDEVLGWAWDNDRKPGDPVPSEDEKAATKARRRIAERISKQLDYHARTYLLEALKAQEVVPYIRAQLDLGRKVVVFHDRKKGWKNPSPFKLREVDLMDAGQEQLDDATAAALAQYRREFADLIDLDLETMSGPIQTLVPAFRGRIDLLNGDVPRRERDANLARFNADDSGPRVLLVQSSISAGWSGHDTTGKHQRVLVNLGLPTKPTQSIQQEGRIYRTGQASDAVQRYLNTGTTWERIAFAQTIAERAGTTENLAMGEEARALKEAFIAAFEQADGYPPGHEDEGKGGKLADKVAAQLTSEYDAARSFYWANQKKTSRTKAAEGKDYFATPEPIGLKLVQWLGLRDGETGMEPSAGHGAIARWFPEHIPTLTVEPSPELRSRLALVFNGSHATIRGGTFEELDIGANKADGIAMNPPFGLGGSDAAPHLAKAVKHLREGGRVAAIYPMVPMADRRLAELIESDGFKGVHMVADIRLPAVTFNRAGTGVATRIVVFDKGFAPNGQPISRDLSSIEDINELFDRLEDLELPARGKPEQTTAQAAAEASAQADAAANRNDWQAVRAQRARERELREKERAERSDAGATLAESLGLTVIEHVTGKGKTLRGVIRPDLTKSQVEQFDAFPFRKDGGWFIRERDLARAHELFPFPPVASEPGPGYSDAYATDLFGDPLPAAATGRRARRTQRRAAADGDVDAAGEVRDTDAPDGEFYTRTIIGVDRRIRVPFDRVTEPAQAAAAFAHLADSAVERFDALVTDAEGRPLAFVGGFKGSLSQTSVYPATIGGEAVRVPGAANLWLGHNHPSGETDLSRADEHLSANIARVFDGSGIAVRGILATNEDGRYTFQSADGHRISGEAARADGGVTVPSVERRIAAGRVTGKPIGSPADAKDAAQMLYERTKSPGLLLLTHQHTPAGWVPLPEALRGRLSGTGGLRTIYRAMSEANAGAALIVHGGELDVALPGDATVATNIGAALRNVDVRVLDIINAKTRASAAERGEVMQAGAVFHRDAAPAGRIDHDTAVDLAAAIAASWRNGPKVIVVRNMLDPAIPAEVRAEDARQRRSGATGEPRGFFYRDTAYVVSGQIDSEQELATTLFHEVLGHAGLRGAFGDALKPLLRELARTNRDAVQAKAREYGLDMSQDAGRMAAAEEVLAEMAQTRPSSTWVRRAVAAVRHWLRRNLPAIFGDMRLSDAELIERFIVPARRFIGRGGMTSVSTKPGFSRQGAANVLHALSQMDELFALPKSGATTIEDIARDIDPGIRVEANPAEGLDSYSLHMPDGTTATIFVRAPSPYGPQSYGRPVDDVRDETVRPGEDEHTHRDIDDVWVNVAAMKPGRGWGAKVYAIAGDFAHNTGRVFIGDPAGLSGEAMRRRPEQMLSSALRWGTTTHLAPHPRQMAGDPEAGVAPLQWVEGDDIGNIRRLIDLNLRTLENLGHDDRTLRFDATTGRFLDAAGQEVARAGMAQRVEASHASAANTGSRTSARAAVWRALLREAGRGDGGADGRPAGLLADLASLAQRSPEVVRALFSRAAEDEGAAPARQAFSAFMNAATARSSNRFNALHKSLSTQLHKAWVDEDFARVFGHAQSYERDIARAAARPAERAPDLLPSFDNVRSAWARLWRGDRDAERVREVGAALWAGTLENGPSPADGRVWSDAELRERFALDDQQVELYRQARAAIDASLDETAAALAFQMLKQYAPQLRGAMRQAPGAARAIIEAEADMIAAEGEGAQQALADALAVLDRADALKSAGYAPLMRFGRYAVSVTDADGELLHFEKFDSELQAKTAEMKLRRAYPGASVERSTMSEQDYKLFAGVDPESVALFADQLAGKIDDDALQAWYRNAVSERSALKRMIGPRKGMPGFSGDLRRVLASFITSNARLAARQFNMGDMMAAIDDMRQRRVAGDVIDEAVKLKEYLDNPDEPFKGLRSLMFTWYLGGSVAAAAVNATQPIMMTLPYLSQFGAAAKHLSTAVSAAMSGRVQDEELSRALHRAAEDGKVDPQEVHHLYHEGMSGLIDKMPGGSDLKARAQGAATLWGLMFGAVENFNRRLTFIAAYRMAKADAKLGDPYAFAVRAIDETQGIYGKSNRPNWARGTGSFGAVGVAAFTFKQYSIAYVELLVRMAKSGPRGKAAALGMLGLMMLASGLQGMPGADDLEDLIDATAQRLGYRGNSRAAMRETLHGWLGATLGDMVMYGAGDALPIDIQSRLGIGNLLPATGLLTPSNRERKGDQMLEVLGPMGSWVRGVIDAADTGVGGSALAVFAPLAVKNALVGIQMGAEGQYSDMRGRKVVETDALDAAVKAVGFQPVSVSRVRRPERMVAQDITRVRQVEADIVGLRAQAIAERDPELRREADAMLRAWNERNPELPIRVKDSQVVQRVRQMRRTSAERLLTTAPRETRRALADVVN